MFNKIYRQILGNLFLPKSWQNGFKVTILVVDYPCMKNSLFFCHKEETMREIIKLNTPRNNPLPTRKVRPRRKKYLELKRQRETDAIVEFTRNQLIDSYDG